MAENELLNSTAVDTANEYDASEIQVLEGLEAVRHVYRLHVHLRPAPSGL